MMTGFVDILFHVSTDAGNLWIVGYVSYRLANGSVDWYISGRDREAGALWDTAGWLQAYV